MSLEDYIGEEIFPTEESGVDIPREDECATVREYTKEGALIIARAGNLRVIKRPLRKKRYRQGV